MRSTRPFLHLAPLALFAGAVACGTVPDDPGARIFTPAGVIQGTVLYQGPHPCSFNGHIVGNAILLVFDRRNPPPPNGLAVLPANFADVTGDQLFVNEPRYSGTDSVYCPMQHGFTDTITVSAPFAISPLDGASYEIEAFFDYTGDFLPTFKIRQLPEQGDIGGGVIDTANALEPINQNPNYQAHFLPVDVGTPEPLASGETIPTYDIPSSGYVTNNVVVSIGQTLQLTRPYMSPQGMTVTQDPTSGALTETVVQSSETAASDPTGIANTAETDPNYEPILTIPQDIGALSAPSTAVSPNAVLSANQFESVLPHLTLRFGVPAPELSLAADPTQPFHFQLQSGQAQGSIAVWQNAYFDPNLQQWLPLAIPEGVVPMLWPEVILSKLIDSTPPEHPEDPGSLTAQGAAGQPVVIMQGITFLNEPQPNPLGGMGQPDTLINTVLGQGTDVLLQSGPYNGALFNPTTGQPTVFQQDHIVVGLRPVVICFNHLFDDPPAADTRGILVTPQSGGAIADFGNPPVRGPIVPPDLLTNADAIQPNSSAITGQPLTGLQTRAQVTNLVSQVQFGCLPKGRYAINVVYPDGQAWTVPNEAGACSGSEGTSVYNGPNGALPDGSKNGGPTCTIKPRPLLLSQGNRAVVEIVGPTNPANCQQQGPGPSASFSQDVIQAGQAAPAVPTACLPTQ